MLRWAILATVAASGTAILVASGDAHAADQATLGRGRYLVERIGMCGDCHTPRGPGGTPVVGAELTGAPIGFAPNAPMPWAGVAPPLAGGPAQYSQPQLVAFLETGKRPDGSVARPPMPAYRLSHGDAAAMSAFIWTLPRAP